jgi:hypothetical protein
MVNHGISWKLRGEERKEDKLGTYAISQLILAAELDGRTDGMLCPFASCKVFPSL